MVAPRIEKLSAGAWPALWRCATCFVGSVGGWTGGLDPGRAVVGGWDRIGGAVVDFSRVVVQQLPRAFLIWFNTSPRSLWHLCVSGLVAAGAISVEKAEKGKSHLFSCWIYC
jgi:hypothetical protein